MFSAFAEEYPEAPVYTTVYRESYLPQAIPEQRVRSSFLQRIPGAGRWPRFWLPLYASATESLDFSGFDVVVSSSSAWMKGIRPGGACHVCYCHSLMKWVWHADAYFRDLGGRSLKLALSPILARLKAWDLRTAAPDRVYRFLTNSNTVRERIRRFWARDATVLHPGIDVSRFEPTSNTGDYYLVVSRLNPYKRVDVAVSACSRVGVQLKVVGDGPDLPRLKQIAGPSVQFLGYQSDSEIAELMRRCRALLFPGEDDFGITPVEVMASGRPVLALRKGGALETVVAGETGDFFDKPNASSLIEALKRFSPESYRPEACRRRAEAFSIDQFRKRLRALVEESWHSWREGVPAT